MGRVNTVRRDGDDGTASLLERFVPLYSSSLVPEEYGEANDKKKNPEDNPFERTAYPAALGLPRYFGE